MKLGETFNGGVMVVTPSSDVFERIVGDVQRPNSWHMATTYPETFYLKHMCDWHALDPCWNLCVRLTKGQALTHEWLRYSIDQISILHFMSDSKPYYWSRKGTIEVRPAHEFRDFYKFEHQIRIRASAAFNAWHRFLGTAVILVARRCGWARGDKALGVLFFMRCKFCAYKRRRML